MVLKGKKVLVTGAGGFIGSHLTERLVGLGAEVSCFVRYNSRNSWGFIDAFDKETREKIKVTTGDLKDGDAVRHAMKGMDIVFHLGALIAIPYSYVHPRDFVQTNVLGTLNLLTAAREEGVERFVHTSTSEVYGSALTVPITEEHPLQGQSPYSATKIGADKLAESFYYAYGFPVATLRPFNTYGPRQSARAIIPSSIIQALSSKEIRFGAGEPTRDFTYVGDTVEGFIKISQEQKAVGQTINIGSGKEIAIKALLERIQGAVGNDVKLVHEPARLRPKKSEVMRLCADTTKAREMLGWEPKVTLDEGLSRTVAWIRKNLNQYKTELYNI